MAIKAGVGKSPKPRDVDEVKERYIMKSGVMSPEHLPSRYLGHPRVNFKEPFDHECLGVVVTVSHEGEWNPGVQSWDRRGFVIFGGEAELNYPVFWVAYGY